MITEAQSGEVERLLLYISDARNRAGVAAVALARDGAVASVVDAVRDAQRSLDALHRELTQRTFYDVDA